MSASRILLYTACSVLGAAALVGLLALALSSGAFTGNGADNAPAEERWAKPPVGVKPLYEKAKAAVEVYQQRVQNDPQSHIEWRALGNAYMWLARATGEHRLYVDAEYAHKRSLEIMPKNNADAQASMATCILMQHRFKEGLEFTQAALKEAPKEAMFVALRADALLGLGRYDEAEAACNEYARLKPGPHALARTAMLYELRGNRARARETLKQVRRGLGEWEEESQAWVCLQLALLDLGEGKLEDARKLLLTALLWSPQWPTALQFLARCEEIAGDFKKAREHLVSAADVARAPETLLPLSRVERELGNSSRAELLRAEALRHFQVHLSGGDTSHLRNHALALLQAREKPEFALELASQDVSLREDVFSCAVLAWARSANGLHKEALEALSRALRLGTEDANLWLVAERVYRAAGEPAKADAALERARKLNPLVKGREVEWLAAWR